MDVAFREDECRTRKDHSARNLAMIRRAVLNLLRREPSDKSLKRKRLKALMNPHLDRGRLGKEAVTPWGTSAGARLRRRLRWLLRPAPYPAALAASYIQRSVSARGGERRGPRIWSMRRVEPITAAGSPGRTKAGLTLTSMA